MSKVPEYTKRAWRSWYARNKDNEDFKEKRKESNRRSYEKRKLKQIKQEAETNIIVNKLDHNNSNIVVETSNIVVDNSNIVVNKIDDNNSNIIVNETDEDEANIDGNLISKICEKVKRKAKKEYENEIRQMTDTTELEDEEWDLKRGVFVKDDFASINDFSRFRFSLSKEKEIKHTLRQMKQNKTNLKMTKRNF